MIENQADESNNPLVIRTMGYLAHCVSAFQIFLVLDFNY